MTPKRASLSLLDAICIIVGIVVGTAIFKTPQLVFANVSGPWQGLGCWLLGGVLALVGALCYAELATTYPRMGGDYVYLSRAFGPWAGFLFGWAQLAIILTGSIGAMAYAFADYAIRLWNLQAAATVWLAIGAILLLTVLNLLGVVFGKAVQNILTITKVLGLALIVVAGLFGGGEASLAPVPIAGPGFGLAMVFVFYAYGGWNDAAFVAAEVQDRDRNLPRALIGGTIGITLIYLLVNGAYLWGLGFEGVRASSAPAADVARLAMGDLGGRAVSLLVMISALGAINGLILTGSRVHVSLGSDHRLFARLAQWSPKGAPVASLLAQSAIALLLILLVGTATGQGGIDRILGVVGFGPLPWSEYHGGFNTLVAGTAPVFWTFFLMTGIAIFVLRRKDVDRERPFSLPFYPLEPLLFCSMCLFMLKASLSYAKALSLLGLLALVVGLIVYLLGPRPLLQTSPENGQTDPPESGSSPAP